jgi:hypothetical protein
MSPTQLAKYLKQWAFENKLINVASTSGKSFLVMGSGYSLPLAAVNSVFHEAAHATHPEAALKNKSLYTDNKLNELYQRALEHRIEYKL